MQRMAVTVILGLIGLFTVGCSNEPVIMNEDIVKGEHTIHVQAEGEVETEPDVAYVSVRVEVDHQDADQAQQEAREKMEQVHAKLLEQGIEETDIETSNFNVRMNRDYSREKEVKQESGSTNPIIGYTVTNEINVEITELDNIGVILDDLANVENTVVSNVTFGLLDREEAKQKAATNAVNKAQKQAETIAEELELNVVDIKKVVVNNRSNSTVPSYREVAEDGAASNTPVSPKDVKTIASVEMTFVVEKR